MLRFLGLLAVALTACGRAPSPAPIAPSDAASPPTPALDADLAACEQDEWSRCPRPGPAEALGRYRAGCEAGVAGDCARTALLSDELAVRAAMMERACAGGVELMCRLRANAWLALARSVPTAVERSIHTARGLTLLEAGCAADDAYDCISLAVLYADGKEVRRDAVRARAAAERVCAKDSGPGCRLRARVECGLTDSCPPPVDPSTLPLPPPPPPPPRRP